MHPMSGTPGENEPVAPEPAKEDKDYKWEIIVGLLIPVAAAGFAHYIARKATEPDLDSSFKLQSIHAGMMLCRDIASVFGGWAINLEHYYNQTVRGL